MYRLWKTPETIFLPTGYRETTLQSSMSVGTRLCGQWRDTAPVKASAVV
jgi:hypothetical protein